MAEEFSRLFGKVHLIHSWSLIKPVATLGHSRPGNNYGLKAIPVHKSSAPPPVAVGRHVKDSELSRAGTK